MKNGNAVQVQCVVADPVHTVNATPENTAPPLLWPVLKSFPVAAAWPIQSLNQSLNQNLSFYFVFTSARAVRFFAQSFPHELRHLLDQVKKQPLNLRLKLRFASVGSETYRAALQELCTTSSFALDRSKQITHTLSSQALESQAFGAELFIPPCAERGLKAALLHLANLTHQEDQNASLPRDVQGGTVVTGQDGNTRQILAELNSQSHAQSNSTDIANGFNWNVLNVYRLEKNLDPLPIEVRDCILGSAHVEFACKSGRVALETVELLRNFCGVSEPSALPAHVLFAAWESSAAEQLRNLGLSSRMRLL